MLQNFGKNILTSPREQDVEWDLPRYKLIGLLEMFRLYADKFVSLTNTLTEMASQSLKSHKSLDWGGMYNTEFGRLLNQVEEICLEIGLQMSAVQASNLINLINSMPPVSNTEVQSDMRELVNRIEDELSMRLCIVIKQDTASYFAKLNPFGDEVFNKFSSANFDIEEAGKCFALARYTACVMHLQRVLEIGLKSYGNFLGIMALITTPQPSWHNILGKTLKEIKERNDNNIPAKVWVSNREKEFCDVVQPFLESVKVAWRNPSMHAEAKYTEEEAKEIFDAVKGFMRHLAEHLDESGTFTV